MSDVTQVQKISSAALDPDWWGATRCSLCQILSRKIFVMQDEAISPLQD